MHTLGLARPPLTPVGPLCHALPVYFTGVLGRVYNYYPRRADTHARGGKRKHAVNRPSSPRRSRHGREGSNRLREIRRIPFLFALVHVLEPRRSRLEKENRGVIMIVSWMSTDWHRRWVD